MVKKRGVLLIDYRGKNMKEDVGAFSNMFGINPRNRIIEFFLEMRELDFSIGDVAKEIGLNRATTYNTMEELIKTKYIIPTRKVSGSQLYKLNITKKEVKILIKTFNLLLKDIVNKYEASKKVVYA